MKKLIVVAVLLMGGIQLARQGELWPATHSAVASGTTATGAAQGDAGILAPSERHDATQVTIQGVVSRLLKDDNDGSRHQRFIVTLGSGQTVLIAHNIDLAPRVESLKVGDPVDVFGEFEWNNKGGVIHWTHRDPRGKHPAGWIRHRGRTYR